MISGIHNLHSKIGFVVITTLHVRGSAGLGRLRLKVGQPDRTTPPIIDLSSDLAVESGRTAFGQHRRMKGINIGGG